MAREDSITIRIDKQIKADATDVIDSLGLSLSAAITLFLRQVALRREIPFRLSVDNRQFNWDNPAFVRADPRFGYPVLSAAEDAPEDSVYDKLYAEYAQHE
ncbi:MAG: type II toxin-antitoxin system RelB/DinJ family antitoxin [Actinomycetes bacterium]|nr:type II toxin-antitoxin system RelB/DinJ family antitoxin [Actinomycetes bacterium]